MSRAKPLSILTIYAMTVLPGKKKHLEILLLYLLFSSCFGLILLDFRISKYLFTLALFAFCLSGPKATPCRNAVLCYALSAFASCIYSYMYNHQSLVRLVGNYYDYWGLLFVFVIARYKPTAMQLEKSIRYLSVTYCVCYVVQWLAYPVEIFLASLSEFSIGEDYFRMRLPGSMCAYCLFFMGVNKYVLYKRKSDLFCVFLGFLPIIIMGFRSLVSLTVLCTLIMIPILTRSVARTFVWLVFACVVAVGISRLNPVRAKVNEMMERQRDDQTFDNADYVRYMEYDFFSGTVFVKPGEKFFGGGLPVSKGTPYYNDMIHAAQVKHYGWNDLGVIGLSYIIGIPAVCLLVGIVAYCIYKAKGERIQYVRFTLLTALLGSIVTSMELFRTGNMLVVSLYLCLVHAADKELCPPHKAIVE